MQNVSVQQDDLACFTLAFETALARLKSTTMPFSQHRAAGQTMEILERKIYETRRLQRDQAEKGFDSSQAFFEQAVANRESIDLVRGFNELLRLSLAAGSTDLMNRAVSHLHPQEAEVRSAKEFVGEIVAALQQQLARSQASAALKKQLAALAIRALLNNGFWFTGYSTEVKNLFGPAERDAKFQKISYLPELKTTLETLFATSLGIYSPGEFENEWRNEIAGLRKEIVWNSLRLKEGDLWIKTSFGASGPGDFLGGLTNMPGFTNHAGFVGFKEIDGVPVYSSIELTLKFIRKPLNFSQHILLRPGFALEPGFTENINREMYRFPKIVFDTLFKWGIEPADSGPKAKSYIYCTEILHFMYATGMKKDAPEKISPYTGSQIYAQWRNETMKRNAERLGFSDKFPVLFSAPLLFSPNTVLVGGFFLLDAAPETESFRRYNELRKTFEEDFLSLLSTRDFLQPPKLADWTVSKSLALLGLLSSSSFLRGALPEAVQEPLLLADTLDFPPGKEALILKFFVTVQSSVAQIHKLSVESKSSEEALAAYKKTVLPKVAALFIKAP